jgi:hypothetical protein
MVPSVRPPTRPSVRSSARPSALPPVLPPARFLLASLSHLFVSLFLPLLQPDRS